MMDWRQHHKAQRIVVGAVRQCQQLGICIDRDQDVVRMLTVMTEACRQARGVRGFDSAGRPTQKTPDGNPAAEVPFDHLQAVREHIGRALQKCEDGEDRMFLGKLLQLVTGYLGRNHDRESLDARAQRDRDAAPRSHRSRAMDRRLSVQFLGSAPAAGSDMERLELQAARTFGLA